MTRALLAEWCDVEVACAQAAERNAPMSASDEALGFTVVQRGRRYHGDVGLLRTRLNLGSAM
ncbi:MAG: hypothetical protein OEM67_02610 [Thermoleophilia bacterium]|nr:hypothetical protein [Thermoleophilia bacterium]MDH3724378.1 hypothetical protein [Thermoleophilia bacterium]